MLSRDALMSMVNRTWGCLRVVDRTCAHEPCNPNLVLPWILCRHCVSSSVQAVWSDEYVEWEDVVHIRLARSIISQSLNAPNFYLARLLTLSSSACCLTHTDYIFVVFYNCTSSFSYVHQRLFSWLSYVCIAQSWALWLVVSVLLSSKIGTCKRHPQAIQNPLW